jgi:hypothetical protein
MWRGSAKAVIHGTREVRSFRRPHSPHKMVTRARCSTLLRTGRLGCQQALASVRNDADAGVLTMIWGRFYLIEQEGRSRRSAVGQGRENGRSRSCDDA